MTEVTFTYEEEHLIGIKNGIPKATPALKSSGRLYVIMQSGTAYIGTSSDLQSRFKPRLDAIRELGFPQKALDGIRVYSVQIKINNIDRQPDDLGYSLNIDVEGLLIRTYAALLKINVRNFLKWQSFSAPQNEGIDWTLKPGYGVNVPHLAGKGLSYYMPAGDNF